MIEDIITNIQSDTVFLPEPRLDYPWMENRKLKKGKDSELSCDFKDFYKLIDDIKRSQLIIPTNISTIDCFRSTQIYRKVKINQIKEFNEFRNALEVNAPISIDAFLRDHPSYADAGKIMIIYSLLKKEETEAFSTFQISKIKDNWYSLLLNDLLSGCKCPEDIFKNEVDFITFNYDLSLDYCLSKKISNVEFFQKSAIGSDYAAHILEKRIHHVYGQIYETSKLDEYGVFNSSGTLIENNIKRFIKACQSRSLIKTMGEERTTVDTSIKEKIAKSKEIIIFGFSFDPQNLSVIDVPNKYSEYLSFLEKKTVKFLNYKGSMKNVTRDFEKVRKHQHRIVIESMASSITEAYQNEFKIILAETILSMTHYNLLINEKQARIISLALDIYSRLQNGQLDWCFSMIPWHHKENLEKVEHLLHELKKALTGMDNGYLGIGNVSEEARIAYDIHQVVRCAYAPFDKPYQWSQEKLPVITEIEKTDSINLSEA